ncbi:ABC transporter ATP-binding protein [Bacillus sp. FJAT-27264]|uniref:ABC transporter ATP-binding protein n=1 Tax=Paenibacillus sp. (strain DSM 101736 / FJAT-27264) TaxID=1850362 RepID=UPI000807B226|nr:ABC transporter ATP-binding protein [Bacillus sp. FJAT-27264]OBZ16350.1 ABC transporter ATP-binding protein [Bacillus sp. FJAT-27264]
MNELIIRDLAKSFGDVQALKPANLHIKTGSFTTLLGPSGCGKTTLLRLLAGLETPDAGEILADGEPIYSVSRRVNQPVHRRNFGMVFQDFALWPHLSVFENVAFGLRAARQKQDLRGRVLEALRTVRLDGLEERYPHQLSGGQQQRVAFARAVVTRPRLVLFDEPLSALDAILRDEMRVELISLVKNIGITALYVTHDQSEAMSMSDEVVVMQGGHILQSGAPEEIYRTPRHPFVARFIGKSNWVIPDQQMLRPEQLRWFQEDNSNLSFHGTIRHVSYMGDRYEMILDMQEMGQWIAYHEQRLRVGDNVCLYAAPGQIHNI